MGEAVRADPRSTLLIPTSYYPSVLINLSIPNVKSLRQLSI